MNVFLSVKYVLLNHVRKYKKSSDAYVTI